MGWFTRNTKPSSPAPPPTWDQHTVDRHVLAETLQHPATIFPWSLAALAAMYGGLFGSTPESTAVAVGGAGLGLAAWVVNYMLRGERWATEYVDRQKALRDAHDGFDAADLEARCQQVQFAEGAKEVRELREAHQAIRQFLETRIASGNDLSAMQFLSLADDTYREGLTKLERALEVFFTLRSIDIRALQEEHRGWKREFEQNGRLLSPGQRQALEQRIATHATTIDRFYTQVDVVEQLLAQSNSLEAALQSALLELGTLGAEPSLEIDAGGTAKSQLAAAIEAARRVEERLNQASRVEDEQAYLEAGRARRETE